MTDVRRVSPKEAQALVDAGYVHVDVRSVPEFEAGHPAGARNVPLLHEGPAGLVPNPAFLSVMRAVFPVDTKLVLGCRSGGRSLRAARALLAEGYSDVIDQRAGFDAARDPFGQVEEPGWQAAGLPVETGDGGDHSYAVLSRR